MAKPEDAHTSRPRGRRSGTDSSATSREEIIEAAKREFAEHGYDGTTIRSIAARAGCNSKLVHYYFGTKDHLFTTAIKETSQAHHFMARLLNVSNDSRDFGAQFLTLLLSAVEDEEFGPPYLALIRDIGTNNNVRDLFLEFIEAEMLPTIADSIHTDHFERRLGLVCSQILGIVITRYVIELPAITDQSIEQIASMAGPTLDRYLFAPLD